MGAEMILTNARLVLANEVVSGSLLIRDDLVRVTVDDHVPVVGTVWREGRRVA